ncbi:hypothetical protein EV368DRAFT_76795 [Lentinula lateritia]|nr:hypothetical protein EV368DRAFT_76795 [Lentinula lateritia]
MRLLSTLAANTVIYIIFWALFFTVAASIDADTGPQNSTHQELICFPFGECEPCPPDEITTPPHPSSRPPTIVGETPVWEFCGRIISGERADLNEFIACNVLFAVGAMLVVYIRSRRRHALQTMQLAARISLIRNGGARQSCWRFRCVANWVCALPI